MKEENFASVTNIERIWFVDSDEAVYSVGGLRATRSLSVKVPGI